MTLETLKKLIDREFDRFDTIHEIHEGVEYLLSVYEKELETEKKLTQPNPTYIPRYNENLCGDIPDEVPYGTICPCNPANGGSGICGCTLGTRMVKNPKKFVNPITINTPTTDPFTNINLGKTGTDTYKIDENFPGTFHNTGYESKINGEVKAYN